MWTYTNTDTLAHYGVKGMRWGVRKKQIRQDEANRRTSLYKKYGVYDAQEEADIAYDKHGESNHTYKLMNKAHSLEQKAISDLQKEMRQKYGKDYDRYKRGEKVAAALVGTGTATAFIAAPVLGALAVSGIAAGSIKLGQTVVSKMFKG